MPLADLLRPEQRQWLRRLRHRIANREVMRRHRAANRDKKLCAGVDLPLDAGTRGRPARPAHERGHACHRRRQWLLNHALNPAETAVLGLLESIEDAAEAAPAEDAGQSTPLLDDLSPLSDPACAGSAEDPTVGADNAVGRSLYEDQAPDPSR